MNAEGKTRNNGIMEWRKNGKTRGQSLRALEPPMLAKPEERALRITRQFVPQTALHKVDCSRTPYRSGKLEAEP